MYKPAGVNRLSAVARPSVEFQFAATEVVFACPTTPLGVAPANGRNSSDGKISTRLLDVSATKIFPLLSTATSVGLLSLAVPVAPKLVWPTTKEATAPAGDAVSVFEKIKTRLAPLSATYR